MNLYAYVGNDPVNLKDPSGKAGVLAAAPAAAPFCAGPQAAGCAIAAGAAVVVVGGYYGAKWLSNNVFNESDDGETTSDGTRELGELEPIHPADHP